MYSLPASQNLECIHTFDAFPPLLTQRLGQKPKSSQLITLFSQSVYRMSLQDKSIIGFNSMLNILMSECGKQITSFLMGFVCSHAYNTTQPCVVLTGTSHVE